MKAFLFLSLFFLTTSLCSANVSDFIVHKKLVNNNSSKGVVWNLDYVQLKAKSGKSLSSNDLKINKELKKGAEELICPEVSKEELPSEDAYSESLQTTDVTFISDRLLAITVSYSASCIGTAHASNGASSVIYDRSTGKPIDIATGVKIPENYLQKSVRNLSSVIWNTIRII